MELSPPSLRRLVYWATGFACAHSSGEFEESECPRLLCKSLPAHRSAGGNGVRVRARRRRLRLDRGGHIRRPLDPGPQVQRGQGHDPQLPQAPRGLRRGRRPFTEYIHKNVHLYQFRNGIPLTTAAAANFTRGELAIALRKDVGPSLYYIDYIATLHKIEKGAFGYVSYFSLSMMDWHYHSGMSLEEAIDLVDKCIMEIRSRLVVAPPNFVIKIVDKDGAREYAWRESIKDSEVATA